MATPSGPRAIERITTRDRVSTLRGSQVIDVPVLATKRRRAEVLLVLRVGGVDLRVTPEHPLDRGGRWVPARELRAGDSLVGPEGPVAVEAVRVEQRPTTVHTLRVGAPHSFLAEGVLVHNY